MKNLLSIEELTAKEIEKIVSLAGELKKNRAKSPQVLAGQFWALIFNKSSTRTRVSFEVGIRELGGSPMFMSGTDMQLGRGHTKGDTVVWLPREKVLFSGDQVEFGATPYTGDAYHKDWPATLDRMLELGPEKLVPGRGEALLTAQGSRQAIEGTRDFLLTMYQSVKAGREAGKSLSECYAETYRLLAPKYSEWVIFDHCLPFDITRCDDDQSETGTPPQGYLRRRVKKSRVGECTTPAPP